VLTAYRYVFRFARHRRVCIAIAFALPILFRLALLGVLPHPEPRSHDEFAYLLGSDIFAAGKITVPAHPKWEFFESPHVLTRPARAPKYPPAQSAFLAIGQKLTGDPFYGVLLSVGLFAGAMCWMLQAFVAPPWALLAGLSTGLCYGARHYWTETYWGGAVAALGAALLIGSYRRITAFGRTGFGWTFGLGALLLMNARPFECGALVALMTLALLRFAVSSRRWLPTALLGLIAAASITCGYNYAVTGRPLLMPYVLYMQQYTEGPAMLIIPPSAPKQYTNPAIQRVHASLELSIYNEFRSHPIWERVWLNLLTIATTLYVDNGLLRFAPLIFLLVFRRDGSVLLLAAAGVILTGAHTLEVFPFMHYMAPLAVVLIGCSIIIIDRLWRRRVNRRQALSIAVVFVAMTLIAPLSQAVAAVQGRPFDLYYGDGFGAVRARIVNDVMKLPGRHVIFAGLNPKRSPDDEWVHNPADIDAARIVWAHDLGEPRNIELLEYFKGRTFWRLDETGDPRLVPYEAAVLHAGN